MARDLALVCPITLVILMRAVDRNAFRIRTALTRRLVLTTSARTRAWERVELTRNVKSIIINHPAVAFLVTLETHLLLATYQ